MNSLEILACILIVIAAGYSIYKVRNMHVTCDLLELANAKLVKIDAAQRAEIAALCVAVASKQAQINSLSSANAALYEKLKRDRNNHIAERYARVRAFASNAEFDEARRKDGKP